MYIRYIDMCRPQMVRLFAVSIWIWVINVAILICKWVRTRITYFHKRVYLFPSSFSRFSLDRVRTSILETNKIKIQFMLNWILVLCPFLIELDKYNLSNCWRALAGQHTFLGFLCVLAMVCLVLYKRCGFKFWMSESAHAVNDCARLFAFI